MSKKELLVPILMSTLCGAISVLFVFYGLSITLQDSVPKWVLLFSVITTSYGVISLSILLWSWLGGGIRANKLMKKTSILFLALFFLGSWDMGMVSGLEAIAIVGVTFLLWLNWLSVYKVTSRGSHA